MKSIETKKHAIGVIWAAALVLVLAVGLGLRVSARSAGRGTAVPRGAAPTAAAVPEPAAIVLADLPNPFCWGCSWAKKAPLEFQVDLDLLAPLGDGTANAAEWLEQFTGEGPRAGKAYKERKISVTLDGDAWNVLPGDDPLLLEAEPWVDQAQCSFYPEVWQIEGPETSVPDLLMTLDLARSWVARGKLSRDPEQAREDYRRAIRLGRLLRQDDVTVIQDLVAIACIRLGAEALYELARELGDAPTMTVTSLVMADKDAMRHLTARRITTFERALTVEDMSAPELSLRMGDDELDAIVELTRNVKERRFRMEGLISLQVARHLGTAAQRETAESVLDELAATDDALTADAARWLREQTLDDGRIREWINGQH